MKQEANFIRSRLKTPPAAIAGILFAVLLITGLVLLRLSVRSDPLEEGTWLKTKSNTVSLALTLMPFAGISFLWFIGVLRDRLVIDNLRRPFQTAAASPAQTNP